MLKLLLPLSLALTGSTVLAATPVQITIHGGASAQTQAIVTFDAPKDWHGVHHLSGKGGSVVPLQVDGSGRAVMIVPQIGPGEDLVFIPTTSLSTPPASGLTVETAGDVLRFTQQSEGAVRPVFDYQMQAGAVSEGVSEVFKHGAHLHPVYTPGGRLVTGNHPADHRWHRGIWMAWTKTEFDGGHPDFWNQGKGPEGKLAAEIQFQSLVKSWGGPLQAGFISQHRFVDRPAEDQQKPVLDETWEVTVYALTTGDSPAYVLDLVSTQTCATASPLKLPAYHYGGLGLRGHAQWDPADKVTMLTSNGDDRKKGDSTKARWVHMGGPVDGQPAGLAILIHPDNFRFPQPLRLNPKNPQLCIAPSQDGDWAIEPGKPYVSKYRFVISDGPARAEVIEAAWKAYAEPLKVTVK